jgi:hypothetical protein
VVIPLLDAEKWIQDEGQLNNMVKWAREEVWDAEGLTLPHARNRVAKALGASNWTNLPIEFRGTRDKARKLILGYEVDHTENLGHEQPAESAHLTPGEELRAQQDVKRAERKVKKEVTA